MTGLVSVAGGQPIRSTHITQFTRWVQGATKDQSASFTTTHATEYTVTVTNEETSAGNALKIVSGASTIALFNKTGATLSVPLIGTGVLLSSLFSSAGQILVGTGGTAASALNIGAAFQSLNVNSAATALAWTSCLLALATTAGQTFFATGVHTVASLTIGSTGQVLTVSTGALPSWASLPAGQLPASDGTVSAPTINFTSETSTGLFRVTTAVIGFSGNGATAATLSSATATGLQMATNVPIVPAAVSGTPVQHGLYRDNVVKGWVYYTTITTTSILASYNVTSLTDNGTGDTTVTWDRDFSSANYCAVGNVDTDTVAAALLLTARAAGTTRFLAVNFSSVAQDCHGNVIAMGAQ